MDIHESLHNVWVLLNGIRNIEKNVRETGIVDGAYDQVTKNLDNAITMIAEIATAYKNEDEMKEDTAFEPIHAVQKLDMSNCNVIDIIRRIPEGGYVILGRSHNEF